MIFKDSDSLKWYIAYEDRWILRKHVKNKSWFLSETISPLIEISYRSKDKRYHISFYPPYILMKDYKQMYPGDYEQGFPLAFSFASLDEAKKRVEQFINKLQRLQVFL
jgi:hypothetical protein